MQGPIFQNAQRIISQILQWFVSATDSAIEERVSDLSQDGVCINELDAMAIVGRDVDPTLADFFHIEVQTGVAYVAGERTAIFDSPLLTYNPANPAQTTNDGTGNFVLTPLSTGSFNIPLTAGFINYVYIAYLQTIDTSVFTLNDVTLAKQFYRATDGYQIVVNTTGTTPIGYILLGQVNLTGSNQAVTSNISIVNRPPYKTLLNRVGIQTNNVGLTDRPEVYAVGSNDYFLDDHIKSVGTGVISNLNPHGLSIEDLGVNANETVQFHRIYEHQSGIIAGTSLNPFPALSGMATVRVQVTPGNDYIIIKALITGEAAVFNGNAYTSTQFGSDFIISFAGQPDGTYNIYYDGTTIGFTTGDISSDPTKLWLSTVSWAQNAGDGNLSAPFDRRRLGTLDILERWYTSGRPPNPIAGQFGYNIDTNLVEYYNGSQWNNLITLGLAGSVPSGAMLDFGGTSAPPGYLLCDGSAVSRSAFIALFTAIGTTWGVGDGSTTFNLPDFRRRVAVGSGGAASGVLGNTTGSVGGAETHTLTSTEIPSTSVTVNISDPTHRHQAGYLLTAGAGGGGQFYSGYGAGAMYTQYAATGITASGSVNGGNGSHSIVQPSAVVTKIIKF